MTKLANLAEAGAPGITTTLIVLGVLASLTFLTWDGRVNGDAYVSLASAIVGGVLVRAGMGAGAAGAANTAPPREHL